MSNGKVFLVPYYFYLHLHAFVQVLAALQHLGLEAYLLHMPTSSLDETKRFGANQIRQYHYPVQELKLHRLGLRGSSLLARMGRFPEFVLNRHRIKRFLQAQRPSVVVVGSDLGGVYIRLLLDLCRRNQIRVLILGIYGLGETAGNSGEHGLPIPRLAALFLRFLKLERTVVFNRSVIGTYMEEATIAVPGEAMTEWLIAKGVAKERIVITGDPVHDSAFRLKRESASMLKQKICAELGWSPDCRLIVYCSEVIQELYGDSYLDRVNKRLRQTFDSLPLECKVLIRLHPREPHRIIASFTRTFSEPRYRFDASIDILQLLRAADLCLAHFSKTLMDAIILTTPVLCINLMHARIPISDHRCGEIVLESEADFELKIRSMLYNESVAAAAKAALQEWAKKHAGLIDGQSSARVARLIQRLIECKAP